MNNNFGKFKVGDKVQCIQRHDTKTQTGVITEIRDIEDYPFYPIEVRFDGTGYEESFTLDGREWVGDEPILQKIVEKVDQNNSTATESKKYRLKVNRDKLDYNRILQDNPNKSIIKIEVDGVIRNKPSETYYLVRYRKALQFCFGLDYESKGYGIIRSGNKWYSRISELVDVLDRDEQKEWFTIEPIK